MVKMRVGNKRAYVVLTEGYMPDRESLFSQFREAYRRDPEREFDAPESATAWFLSSACQNYMSGSGLAAKRMNTWLIGPPGHENAILAEWFADEPPDTTYRLMIHPTLLQYGPRRLVPDIWGRVYEGMAHSGMRIRHRVRKYKQFKEISERFLEEVLRLFETDPADPRVLEPLMKESGHPYWYSDGLLKPASRSLSSKL